MVPQRVRWDHRLTPTLKETAGLTNDSGMSYTFRGMERWLPGNQRNAKLVEVSCWGDAGRSEVLHSAVLQQPYHGALLRAQGRLDPFLRSILKSLEHGTCHVGIEHRGMDVILAAYRPGD